MYKDEVKQAIFEAFEYIKARNELKEFIKDKLFKAINEDKWITIHPHGDDSEDYRRLKLKDGETPEEAMHRMGWYEKRKAKDEKKQKDENRNNVSQIDESTSKIRDLVKTGFDKHQYYEKLEDETNKLWKIYSKASRETYFYYDESEETKKVKKEKLQALYEAYSKKRDERSKAVSELNDIIRQTKKEQIETLNKIKQNIDIEKSLKSFNSTDTINKINKVLEEYNIVKLDAEYKKIDEQFDTEKDKWLKYINSANSVDEQNKRVSEYDEWYKGSDIKKKRDEVFDKISNFTKYRNKAISKALQIENGGNFNLTTVKRSKLAQKVEETNNLLTGIINKDYLPDFSPFANGQAGRANASGNIINITSKYDVTTYIHESMHWIERVNPKVLANSIAFLEYRTKGETAESLKKLTKINYKANEIAKPDKFFNAYCGKIYDNATEIMSMGIQRLFEQPDEFIKEDKEYFNFVVANLQGKI